MRTTLLLLLGSIGMGWSAADPAGAEVLPQAAAVPAPARQILPTPDSVHAAGADTLARGAAAKDSAHSLAPLASPAPAPTLLAQPLPVRDSVKPPPKAFRTIAIAMDTVGSSRKGRSTWTAVGLTMLLPGAGHRYLGHNGGAALWMTGDLLTWSTLLVAWQMGSLYIEDATQIANRYAGALLNSDADLTLLETMRDWRSRRPVSGRRDSYDEALVQQGLATDSRFPNDDAHNWDWGSPEDPANNSHIGQFGDAIKGYRVSRLVVTYAAGALLLSRVVAVADIIRIRKMSASSAGIQAMVIPRADGGQAIVAYRF